MRRSDFRYVSIVCVGVNKPVLLFILTPPSLPPSFPSPQSMHKASPSFVLRNWIAQDAIEAAEKQDYSRVRLVLALLQDPYHYPEDHEGKEEGKEGGTEGGMEEVTKKYRGMTPAWAAELVCTCSS